MFQKVSQIKTTNSHFKKVFLAGVLSLTYVVGSLFAYTPQAQAAIPKYINFQGKLTAVSGGTNVANGTYSFEFKLYDAVSGGSLLWTETFDQPSGSCGKLTVTNGVFNAKLGSCASLASVDFTGGSVFLSVNFNPGAGYDGEMSPRKQLVSSAFAFVANGVSGDGVVNSTVSSATALAIAKSGSNYALQVDTNTASAVTGLKVTSAAAAGGLALTTLSSGTNENITLDAKGSGTISLGATSTGDVLLGGGSGSTGCTITNSSGAFACTAGLTGVGVNASTGLLQGQLGLTVSGAAVSLNHDSNFAVNIATGTTNTLTTIGGGSGTFSLQTTNIDISSAGAISGATGIVSSGTIQFSALTSNGPLYTSGGNGTLTTTAPTSGAIGYWSRTGTVLSQTTANDTISIANTTTTGADLALTNTGVYTGTGVLNLTANSATTGTLAAITGNALTTGSLLSLSSSSTAALTGQKGLNVALTGALTGAQTTYGGYLSNTRTGGSAVNVGLYATASGATGANYAAIFENGNVGIGTTTPTSKLQIGQSGVGVSSAMNAYVVGGGDALNVYDTSNGDSVAATLWIGSDSGMFQLADGGTPDGVRLSGYNGSPSYFKSGSLGVGTTAPDKRLEINSATGDNLRLTYNDADGTAANYADLLTTSAGALTIQPSGFIANIGGGTTRTAMRFLEPSGTGTDYAAIQANANVTTSYTWSLPAADASGCIQSNGSGALSISACSGAASLQTAYDGTNTITTTTARNIAFTLGEVVTPTSFTIENQDTAATSAQRIFNSIASGTATNGLLIEQTGAGTMTNAIQIAETAGTITDGILITGTLGNILNSPSLDITGAGAISGATGLVSSGTIQFSALTSNGPLYTSAGNGTLTTTAPTSGAIGYWSRTGTVLSQTTANDTISIANTTTTGADLALTNTGVYTGTGIFNLTANSATTGTLATITGNALTTGSLLSLSSSSTAATTGQKGLNVALTGALTGAQTTYGGYFSNTRTGASAVNVGLYATASGATGANYAAIFEAGRVGIGTTTPNGDLTISRSGSDAALTTFAASATDWQGTYFVSNRSRGTVGSPTDVAGGDDIVSYTANAYANSSYNFAGSFGFAVEGTPSGSNVPTYYSLWNTSTSGSAERLRVISTGEIGIGTSAPGRQLEINSAAGNNLRLTYNDADGTAANYADLLMSSGGDLTVTASGSDLLTTNNLVVGAGTSATETLANTGFVYNGDDLFVAGMAGIEGGVYTDGSFIAGASTTISNGSISQSSTETLTIGTTSATLALQTTTSGDITATTGAAAGLFNVLTGNLKVGNATPDTSLNGEDAFIEGTLEVDSLAGAGSRCLQAAADGTVSATGGACGGSSSLQGSYDGGTTIETASNTAVVITETAAAANTGDLLQLTYNAATGGNNAGDALQITMDGVDADSNTGSGLKIIVDQSQNTGSPILVQDDAAVTLFQLNENGGITLGAATAETTAITVTDTDYTNALSIGDNNIIGTTSAIDFTNFDVTSTGDVTAATQIQVGGTANNSARYVNGSFTSSTASLAGVYMDLTNNGSSGQNFGVFGKMTHTGTNSGDYAATGGYFSGVNNNVTAYGVRGTSTNVSNTGGSSSATFLWGDSISATNAGTVSSRFAGSDIDVFNTGTASGVTSGLRVTVRSHSGTMADRRGIDLTGWTSVVAPTNSYGIYADTSIDGGTNKYFIYSTATSSSYMAGNLGLGDASPAALLTVGTGDLFQVNSSGDILTAAAENLSITTGTTGSLTLDTGTTGAINIGTGTAGKTISIGTDNTTKDTINIGSALDDVAISSDSWSITNAGALTVVSCSGCGGGAPAWNSITVPTGDLTLAMDSDLTTFNWDTLTTQNAWTMGSTSLTTGKLLNLASTSNAYTTGNISNVSLIQAAATGTAVSGDISSVAFNPTYSTAVTTPAISGNTLDISRSSTTNASFVSTLTVSGALARFSDTSTQTTGTLTSTANVVEILQNYASNSGSALNVTTAGTGPALRINDDGTLTDSTPFVVDASGRVGIGTASPNTNYNMHLQSAGKAAIYLEADTDNVTETDTSFIKFSQDANTHAAIWGETSGAGFDPENNAYTNTLGNAYLLGTTTADAVQIGTSAVTRMTFDTAGNVGIGDNTPASLFTVGANDLFQVDTSGNILTPAAENLSITTGTTGTLTLDTGTTGAINIGTGTAGKTISIGTNNTTADTINIGSALDDVAISSDSWSITNAGALTVVSCSGCGGGGGALDTLTAATTDDAALTSGDNTIEWNWALSSSTSKGFTIGESAASSTGAGDQHILRIDTASTSTAGPLEIVSNSADGGDIEFNLASAGDFEIQDAGTAFVTFTDGGLVQVASTVTTGTGTSAGFSATSSTLTSGTLMDLTVTGAGGLTNQKGLNVSTSGAVTGAQTTYGGFFSNTHSGATAVNVGLYATASGATGANYAAIFDQGSVGIGDTTPDYLLDVAGNIGVGTGAAPGQIISNANAGDYISFANASSQVDFYSNSTNYLTINGTAAAMYFNGANANIDFYLRGTVDNAMFYADSSAQSIGIGTSGPDRKLDILDASSPQLRLTQTDGTVYSDLQVDSNGDLLMNIDGATNQLVLDNGGNVGIGTAAPASKLTVDSNSNTASVRILGATEATEIADIYVQTGSRLVLDTTAGGGTSGYIDIKGEDDEYGLVLRDSSGVSTGWTNFYMNDVATDYLNVCLNCTNAGVTGLVVQDGGNVGVGTTGPDRNFDSLDASAPQARLTTTDGTVYADLQNTATANLVVTGDTLTSSSAKEYGIQIAPTVNQTSSASYTGLEVSVTETAATTLNGLNRLADFRVGGSSKFAVRNDGSLTLQDASGITTPYGGIGSFQNHLVRSEEFDNASWVKTSVTAPTANNQVAPDGSTSAESLATSGSGGDVCQWSGTAAASDTFTFSVWAKATSGTQTFDLRVDAGATSCATANNVTGTAVTHTATTSWQRFTVTQTFSSATGNVKARIFPGGTGGSGTVYAWGAQLDKDTKASTYVLTTSGALTNANKGQVLESNFATASGFTYGGRHVSTLNGSIVASSSTIGQLIRVIDNASGTDDTATVRGLEVQSYSGTNINGVNTAVAAFGYTFGVHAVSTGQANEAAQPAAVFADLDNGSAPTFGNAIRAYSNDATSADLVSIYQETSAYSGNALEININGTFTGNFADFQTSGTTKFKVDKDGNAFATLNTGNSERLCWDGAGGTAEEIFDCTGTPGDLAENFGTTDASIEAMDIVVSDGHATDLVQKGEYTTKAFIEKSTKGYQSNIIGVISTNPNEVYANDIFTEAENPRPVALVGRVPVKVTLENGPIVPGDYITSSNTEAGKGMKATRSGMVVGQALSGYDGTGEAQVIVFVNTGFQSIGNSIVLDAPSVSSVDLQSGSEDLTSNNASTFVIQQQASEEEGSEAVSNILQLQTGDANRFMVSSTGATSILSNLSCEPETLLENSDCPSVLKVTQANTELMNIDARGTLTLAGTIFIKDDSFAGSVVTAEDGLAEITFSYNLGTGKPVVQLTAESQIPVFAQIVEFKQDENGNYTGFVMKTFDLLASPVQAVVHYNVTGKQADYITLGDVVVPEIFNAGDGAGLIIDGGEVLGGTTDGNTGGTTGDPGVFDESYPPLNPDDITGVVPVDDQALAN